MRELKGFPVQARKMEARGEMGEDGEDVK